MKPTNDVEVAGDMAHIIHAVVTVNKTCVSCGLVMNQDSDYSADNGSPAIIAL